LIFGPIEARSGLSRREKRPRRAAWPQRGTDQQVNSLDPRKDLAMYLTEQTAALPENIAKQAAEIIHR
jgi:hypothetical protein